MNCPQSSLAARISVRMSPTMAMGGRGRRHVCETMSKLYLGVATNPDLPPSGTLAKADSIHSEMRVLRATGLPPAWRFASARRAARLKAAIGPQRPFTGLEWSPRPGVGTSTGARRIRLNDEQLSRETIDQQQSAINPRHRASV